MLKKILVIFPEFNKDYLIYQPWKQIFEICKKLQLRGIDVAIGTNATSESIIHKIKIISFKETKLRKLHSSFIDKILEFNPDVILWIGNPLSGFYLKKIKLNSIPIILYISTSPVTKKEIKNFSFFEIFQLGFFSLLAMIPLFTKIIKSLNHENIAGIIVPNKTIHESLINLGVFKNKIKIAPFCFEPDNDLKNFHPVEKPNSDFTLCYFGPVYSIRGVDFLLDVIQLLKKNNLKLKLKFLLRTTEIKKDRELLFQKCKKRKILDFLEIKSGILDRTSLFSEISNSDVVIIPTKFVWNEPPLAILEAMYLKKLLITSNACGLPELVNNHGYTLDLKPELFFNCIQNLIINNESLEKTASEAQTFVKSLPDWAFFADWLLTNLEDFKIKLEK